MMDKNTENPQTYFYTTRNTPRERKVFQPLDGLTLSFVPSVLNPAKHAPLPVELAALPHIFNRSEVPTADAVETLRELENLKQRELYEYAKLGKLNLWAADAPEKAFLIEESNDLIKHFQNEQERAKSRYDFLKLNAVPALTAGLFKAGTARTADNLTGFTCVLLDYDKPKAPPSEIWEGLRSLIIPSAKHLFLFYLTPRAIRVGVNVTGLTAPTPDVVDWHYKTATRTAADYIQEHFSGWLGEIDLSSLSAVQAQAVWNVGQRVYITADSEPLPVEYTPPPKPPKKKNDFERRVKAAAQTDAETDRTPELRELEAKAAGLVDFPYTYELTQWIAFVSAMARIYGPHARALTVRLCSLNAGYDTDRHRQNTDRAFTDALNGDRRRSRKAGYPTIRAAFEAAGIALPRYVAPISDAPTLPVPRYLGDRYEQITSILEDTEEVVNIQAPTGTGKTAFAVRWLNDRAAVEPDALHVIITPNKAVCRIIAGREGIAALHEGKRKRDVARLIEEGTRVFISTPDSFKKLLSFDVPVSTVIVDEFHDLPNAAGYRPAVTHVFNWLEAQDGGVKIVTMTATPPTALLMAIGGDSRLGTIRNLKIERTETRTEYRLKWAVGSRADLLSVVKHHADEGYYIAVQIDRKTDAAAGKSVYQIAETLRAAGLEVGTATAENADGIKELQDGTVKLLIGTRIVNAGYDVHAAGSKVLAVQVTTTNGISPEDAAQLAGRFRDAADVTSLIWVFGKKGSVLKDSCKRPNAAPNAAPFDVVRSLNESRKRTLRECGTIRQYERRRELADTGRAPTLREHNNAAQIDPLGIAAVSLTDRNRNGGLQAFISAFDSYVKLAERPEALDVHELLMTAPAVGGCTGLDGFLIEADRIFKDLPAPVLLTAALSHMAESEYTENKGRELADRWQCDAHGKAAPYLLAEMAKYAPPDWAADRYGLIWYYGIENIIKGLAALLKALAPEATQADALSIIETLPARTAAAIQRHRDQYITTLKLEGGITDDIPAEIFDRIPSAQFLNQAAAVRKAAPLLIGTAPLSARELYLKIRELTGLDLPNADHALRLARAVFDLSKVTRRNADGKRTTLLRIDGLVTFDRFKQSYTPRAAVLEAVERYERTTGDGGTFQPFRLCLSRKMQPYQNDPFSRQTAPVSADSRPKPPDK